MQGGHAALEYINDDTLIRMAFALDHHAIAGDKEAAARRARGIKRWATRVSDPTSGVLYAWMTPRPAPLRDALDKEQAMFLVLLLVDEDVKRISPSVQSAVVADDYQILVIDDGRQVSRTYATAAQATFVALGRRNLPVSMKKIATIARRMG